MGTSTSSFGVGKRESHDSTDFHARFAAPEISDDDELGEPSRAGRAPADPRRLEMPAESTTRVGHPAPFPVALAERCIQLFTYGDVVLDPFMESATTAVASVNTGRHDVGDDTDPADVRRARERVASMVPELTAIAERSRRRPGHCSMRPAPSLASVRGAGRPIRDVIDLTRDDAVDRLTH